MASLKVAVSLDALPHMLQSIVMEGPVQNASNVTQNVSPWVTVEQGPTGGQVLLRWTSAVNFSDIGTNINFIKCNVQKFVHINYSWFSN